MTDPNWVLIALTLSAIAFIGTSVALWRFFIESDINRERFKQELEDKLWTRLDAELEKERTERLKLEADLRHAEDALLEYAWGVGLLLQQIRELGQDPAWRPPSGIMDWLTRRSTQSPAITGQQASPVQLTNMVEQHFTLNDIRAISAQMTWDYENLAGDTKRMKAQSLVQRAGMDGRLPELITILKQKRPLIQWPETGNNPKWRT